MWANALSKDCLLSLHPPYSGSLERSEAEPWGHPSPSFMPLNPETGVPWPVETQDVCVHVQVWLYVCAYYAHFCRELRGWVGGDGQ